MRENCTFRLSGGRRRALQWAPPPTRQSGDGKAVHMAKEGSGYRMQAGGGLMTDTVNTGFVLDMQRKLYRWSTADTGKVFADLFNLVCDRRTIDVAWQRLSQNTGSQTPG